MNASKSTSSQPVVHWARTHSASKNDHSRHLIAAWRDDHHRPHSSIDGLTPREYHQRPEEDQTLNSAKL